MTNMELIKVEMSNMDDLLTEYKSVCCNEHELRDSDELRTAREKRYHEIYQFFEILTSKINNTFPNERFEIVTQNAFQGTNVDGKAIQVALDISLACSTLAKTITFSLFDNCVNSVNETIDFDLKPAKMTNEKANMESFLDLKSDKKRFLFEIIVNNFEEIKSAVLTAVEMEIKRRITQKRFSIFQMESEINSVQ